jgi:protein TonB
MWTNIHSVNSQIIDYLPVNCQTNTDWISINPKGEEFAISLPELPIVYSSWTTHSDFLHSLIVKKNSHAYGSSAQGVVYVIMSFKGYSRDKGKPDKVIEPFIEGIKKDFTGRSRNSQVDITFESEITLNNFIGKQYRASINGVVGILRCYIAKNHIYLLEAIGGDESNLSIQRFLSSFTLGNQTVALTDDSSTSVSQPKRQHQETDKIFSDLEVDRKALIVLRREPQYTDQARQLGVKGTIAVKAVLSASGKVTEVELVRGLPGGLSESAIDATREIRFVPAMKNGKFVSQYIPVEYFFDLY